MAHAEAQRDAITVSLADGRTVTPMALADEAPDTCGHTCLDHRALRGVPRPRGRANPATEVQVLAGAP